jgi:predicted O-methyltransferase YrrM
MSAEKETETREDERAGWRSRMRLAMGALRGDVAAEAIDAEPEASAEQRDDTIDAAIEMLRAAPIRAVQERGYHFQPCDFYSPVNDLSFLEENWDLWHDRPLPRGIAWDVDAQFEEVRRISRFLGELDDVPTEAPSGPPRYHWNNNFWRGADALIQYCLLRDVKPSRVVEIGCGWSSLLMAEALERNREEGSEPTTVDQVEPFPRKELLRSLPEHWTLHETILQRAEPALFETLEAGDICFYDGSHVARAGSDVVWFFFEILPRLKPGVLIHVHDIFWPADYPDEWIFERGQTWNEQYLLQAFLMHNDAFEVVISNSVLCRNRPRDLEDLFRQTPETQYSGSSVWLKKTSAS